MSGRSNREYQLQRISHKKSGHLTANYRRPFWLSASNYYSLTISVTIIFFILIWGILLEGDEETPMLTAFVGAVLMLGCAVAVREIFLRKARYRYQLTDKKLDSYVKAVPFQASLGDGGAKKLTLEKNAALVKEIQKKSDAARSLRTISNGHLEVLESCQEYLALTEKQMETVHAGSPRLVGFRRGREIIGELHRFHLMSWAEAESRALTQKARNYVTISDKLNTAQEALTVLESALQYYPDESRLTESEAALKNFIVSIRVSHWVEQAERAAFKGNYKRAISLYRDALFFLAREEVKTEEREEIVGKINSEIESLRQFQVN